MKDVILMKAFSNLKEECKGNTLAMINFNNLVKNYSVNEEATESQIESIENTEKKAGLGDVVSVVAKTGAAVIGVTVTFVAGATLSDKIKAAKWLKKHCMNAKETAIKIGNNGVIKDVVDYTAKDKVIHNEKVPEYLKRALKFNGNVKSDSVICIKNAAEIVKNFVSNLKRALKLKLSKIKANKVKNKKA